MVQYILLHFVGIHLKYSILYLKRCLSVPSHYQYWLQIIDIHARAISQNISKIWWQFFMHLSMVNELISKPCTSCLSELAHVCKVSCHHAWLDSWGSQLTQPADPASSLKIVNHQNALRNIMFHYREWSTCLLNWGHIWLFIYMA